MKRKKMCGIKAVLWSRPDGIRFVVVFITFYGNDRQYFYGYTHTHTQHSVAYAFSSVESICGVTFFPVY